MKREICCPPCASNWERLDGRYPDEHQKRITGTLHVACICDDCGARLDVGDRAVAVSLYSDAYPYRGPWEYEYLTAPGPGAGPMSDRERTIDALLAESVAGPRGFGTASKPFLRPLIERAYDAGAAATALDLGKRTGPAIGEIIAERDRLREEVDRLMVRAFATSLEFTTSVVDRAAQLEQLVHWMAQTVHQAHHTEGEDAGRTWRECRRGFCSTARRGLSMPAGGQEGE